MNTIVDLFDDRRSEVLSSQQNLTAQDPAMRRNGAASPIVSLISNFPDMAGYYTRPQIYETYRSTRFNGISVDGRIELPHFGYIKLKPTPPDGPIALSRMSDGDIAVLDIDANRQYSIHRSELIGDTTEILNHFPICYRSIFDNRKNIRFTSSRRSLCHIRKALEYIGLINLRNLVTDVVGTILLFSGIERNSFYDPRSHGAIFLRYSRFNDEFSYFEDLIHQSGHAQLSLLLQSVYLIDGIAIDTPVNKLGFGADDQRSLLVAIHGLVTEALICDAMFRLLNISPDLKTPRLLGRLAFATRKLGADLKSFSALLNLFSEDGKTLFSSCFATYRNVIMKYRVELENIKLNGQKYVFSEAVFRRENLQR